jgi:hypothetical protein
MSRGPAMWLMAGALAAGLGGVGFGFYSHEQATRMAETQQASVERMGGLEQQMRTLERRWAERESELKTALAAAEQKAAVSQPEETPAPVRTKPATARPVVRKAVPKAPVEDPRVSQLEQKVSEQDRRLSETQRGLDAARTDLEGRIRSSADELNGTMSRTSEELRGSIARTSDEVAALRRKGERDYYEFDLAKSKAAQRIGPLGLALRKADVKRKRYNMELLVDDNKLEKKSVNLFEPVYVTAPGWAQPLELVVNQVTKDRVAGYLSVPKEKRAEVASVGAERQLMTRP